MGRLARSLASGQGFSSPTDLPSGPSAWAPPLYPYILAGVFKLCGIYSPLAAWIILAFNSVFAALTCVPLYRIAQKRILGSSVARGAAWTWAAVPLRHLLAGARGVGNVAHHLLADSSRSGRRCSLADAPRRPTRLGGLRPALGCDHADQHGRAQPVPLPPAVDPLPLPRPRARRAPDLGLCLLTAAVTISPWLVRNYEVFGKFVFIRDNLPLEMHEANNDELRGVVDAERASRQRSRLHASLRMSSGKSSYMEGEAPAGAGIRARASRAGSWLSP
jgi:hypothetical protein